MPELEPAAVALGSVLMRERIDRRIHRKLRRDRLTIVIGYPLGLLLLLRAGGLAWGPAVAGTCIVWAWVWGIWALFGRTLNSRDKGKFKR